MAGVRVKICGVTRAEDARLAARAGADFVGAVLTPGFSRSVEPATAASFVTPDGGPELVAVLVDGEPAVAARTARAVGAAVIQLHGDEDPADLRALRDEGSWALWKAVEIRRTDDLTRALDRYGEVADGLLVEGWSEGRGGGVGARFPWEALAEVRRDLPSTLTLVVSGGLTPENVADAVARLEPDVVDVSSGVERKTGRKDPDGVRAFVRNARAGRGS